MTTATPSAADGTAAAAPASRPSAAGRTPAATAPAAPVARSNTGRPSEGRAPRRRATRSDSVQPRSADATKAAAVPAASRLQPDDPPEARPAQRPALRVLHVCSELYPLLKTGGLADVTGALPLALARQGCEARVLLPGFPAVLDRLLEPSEVARLRVPWPTHWGEPAEFRLLYTRLALDPRAQASSTLDLYVIDAPWLYQRPGNPYADAQQQPYADNHRRFALLGWVGAQLAQGLDRYWQPACVHSHDWHAGLTSAYLAAARLRQHQHFAASVFTVHNLAYQGLFDARHLSELALPADFFQPQGLEFHGQLSFMKAGLVYSDRISTVSPNYAREIQQADQGHGLDGLLRARSAELRGILNGVDEAVWNPADDPLLAQPYGLSQAEHIESGKQANKQRLQREFGLTAQSGQPLFAVVSRLASQKGLNLVLDKLDTLVARGAQLVVLGSGDAALEAAFASACQRHPQALALQCGYDERLSHLVFAGADVILVPSRFEPCGLTQLYGLKYGCLPLVRRVGGLADTVVDSSLEELADDRATGFVFERFDSTSYEAALRRVFALWARPAEWRQVRARAMAQNFGWDAATAQYLALYREIVAQA
jgi:starch synthase